MRVSSHKWLTAVAQVGLGVSACLVAAPCVADEVERSGVSFGASLGGGVVTHESGGVAAALRLGYALSPTILVQGVYEGLFFSTKMTPGSSSTSLSNWDVYAGGVQFVVLRRLWIRPELAVSRAQTVRYDFGQGGTYLVSHGQDLHPTVGATLGVDVATFKHGALEVALSNWGSVRGGRPTYVGSLLVGFSYY